MYRKLQLTLVAAAIAATGLIAEPLTAGAQTVYYSGNPYHPWMHSRRECLYDGGVWTRNGCIFPGETTYRYGYRFGPRVYYDTVPGTVYYRGGYWRNGVWYRYND